MEDEKKLIDGVNDIKISSKMFARVNTTPIKETYKITRKIGSGAYGEVRK
jgi:hypothetical protein